MHHSFNNWTEQNTDDTLENDSHLLRVVICFYAASLLGGKQVQLVEQSGYLPEWRVGGAREEQETHTYTQQQKKTQYHEAITKIYVFGRHRML